MGILPATIVMWATGIDWSELLKLFILCGHIDKPAPVPYLINVMGHPQKLSSK